MERVVRLGVNGWLRPAWETAFYPQGMPPEWRLAYYNTQFDCVFVRAEEWRACSEAELTEWAEECQAGFLFLLEAESSDVLPASLCAQAVLLATDAPELVWFERGSDLKALAAQLQGRNSATTYVVSRDADLGQIERVRTLLELLGH